MKFIVHPYRGVEDLQAILDLVKRRPAERILDYPSLVDLQELLEQAHTQEATSIWETESGQFAGYALINYAETYANLSFEYAPEFAASGIGDAMITWGEEAFRDRFHGKNSELSSSARAAQPERIELLEKHGFEQEAEYVLHMERDLEAPIGKPQIPTGFILRPVTGEEEDAAWVALHRAGFGTENMTLEDRQAMTGLAGYERDLDLVAVAPDGKLAGYVFGSYNQEEIALCGKKIGFTDPVATHPDFQRRGLAHALLLETMQRFKQRGLEFARLGTSSENIAMQKAAQAAGFCVVDQSYHYSKKLRG
jgi:ribosomal protein S18 acetylase RimI-like enzyme